MPKIKPEIETFARIKVIGVGNSGGNSVNHMINSKVKGIEFIAVDSDAQKLHHNLANRKIHIGKNLTKGLGAGMNPDVGRQSAEETKEAIQEALKGSDMVFIACGFGGGTASGAAPVVARVAREQGILTIAVVTRPFTFEGVQRARISEAALNDLRDSVDTMIVIPNDRILSLVEKETSFLSAFKMCDEILRQAVEGISDLITLPGVINVDFADVRTIMQNAGSALMGIGSAQGEDRAKKASHMAINSPLLDISIDGAKGVLFAISGGDDMTMVEIQEAATIITESIDSEARVIFGAINDERLKKGELKVTVIATGFPDAKVLGKKSSLFQAPKEVNSNPETFNARRDSFTPKMEAQAGSRDSSSGASGASSSPPLREKEIPTEDDESSWDAIPAFLRRRKN